MGGFIDATLLLFADPGVFLVFVVALVAGFTTGVNRRLTATTLAAAVLPFTVALPLTHTMALYGAIFISAAAGCAINVVGRNGSRSADDPTARPPGEISITLVGLACTCVALGGLFAALLAMIAAESVAGFVFFMFKSAGRSALWRVKFAMERSMLVGVLCGFLPGVGARHAAAISTRLARRVSGGPHRIELPRDASVIAMHSAIAAATTAALLPLVVLGLPVGVGAVVIIAAIGLQDLEEGPLFMIEAEAPVRVLFAAAFWASVLAPLLGRVAAQRSRALLNIPDPVMGAGLLVFAAAGVYGLNAEMNDIYTMLGAGIAGYLLRRHGYPLAIVVLGVVLAQIGEPAFVNAVGLLEGGRHQSLPAARVGRVDRWWTSHCRR